MHRYAAVSSCYNDFLAGMVEISSYHDSGVYKWLSKSSGEKLKTVFYGYAALREIIKDKLISAETMVSLNMCAYISGFMILILQSVVSLGISAFGIQV